MNRSDLSHTSGRHALYIIEVQHSESWQQYVDLSLLTSTFAEVHILVLRNGVARTPAVERITPDVWTYSVSDRRSARRVWKGRACIQQHLYFSGTFRPDVVVASGGLSAAVLAVVLGRVFRVSTQLHLSTAVHQYFQKSTWRRTCLRYLVKGFTAVQTETDLLSTEIARLAPDIPVTTLPRFQPYAPLAQTSTTINLQHAYHPHELFLVWKQGGSQIGELHRLLEAAAPLLLSPRCALILLKQAALSPAAIAQLGALQISRQVIVAKANTAEIAYLKAADVLVVTETDDVADEQILQAAILGTAIVMSRTAFREDVFTHGVSALLYEAGNTAQLAHCLQCVCKDVALRTQCIAGAKQAVAEKFIDTQEAYQAAYRASFALAAMSPQTTGDSRTSPE